MGNVVLHMHAPAPTCSTAVSYIYIIQQYTHLATTRFLPRTYLLLAAAGSKMADVESSPVVDATLEPLLPAGHVDAVPTTTQQLARAQGMFVALVGQ